MPGTVRDGTVPLPSQSPESLGKVRGQTEQGLGEEGGGRGPRDEACPGLGQGEGWSRNVRGDQSLYCAQRRGCRGGLLSSSPLGERPSHCPRLHSQKVARLDRRCRSVCFPSGPLRASALLPSAWESAWEGQAEQREQLVPGPKGCVVCQARGEAGRGQSGLGLEHVSPIMIPELWGCRSQATSSRVRAHGPGTAVW